MTKEEECLKALQCLYLEVDASIADDVKLKVLNALDEANKKKLQPDVSGLLPSLEEFGEQKEKYLKQEGSNTLGNAQKIWQDGANWALNYMAKKAKGNIL